MKPIVLYFVSVLFLWGCSSSPKIRDITELFPPKHVRVYTEQGGYRVVWEPSIDESRPDFAGYNLYCTKQSAITIPTQDLPFPILLDKTKHEYKLTDLEPTTQYFLHIRSRNSRGDISLPSQPESTIQTTAAF
ncbi:fibronectin type III domain-containing protein [bacterium]|nr:fibronectin type III domain-containing protein [bacterium]